MRKAVILGLMMLTLTMPKNSRSETFGAIGVGNYSCGKFLDAANSEREKKSRIANPDTEDYPVYSIGWEAFVAYLDGFLTGSNLAGLHGRKMVGEGTDHEGRMAWVENYCRAHPLDNFVAAAIAVRKFLLAQ